MSTIQQFPNTQPSEETIKNEPTSLIIHKELLPFLNISLYLNDIKVISSLTIENRSEKSTKEVQVKISSDTGCIEDFSYNISCIPAGNDVKVPLSNLRMNRDFLSKLSESERAEITIEVAEQDSPPVIETHSIIIHPQEYFGGFQILPELIAVYVTPNHPYIYHIKRKAVEILERQNLKTAFEGYQNEDPERVLQMMSAIYSAIQSEELVYSALPPGYEETGQRLRLLDTIQKERFANCIDLSLLFAACLEAADLNPVLIIVRGHAFIGCWLHDDKFPEIINDDKAAINKRLAKGIREMAAVEATSVCRGNNLRFSDAMSIAEARLLQKEDFLISIDIKRARTARIRPMSSFSEMGLDSGEVIVNRNSSTDVEKNFDLGTIYQDDLLNGNKPKTKQKIWERKLLDLSLRNNLLNLRMTRNMLQLVDIDISNLEDTLSEGKSFSILPNSQAQVLRKYNLFSVPLHPSSPDYKTANDELKYNRLLTYYHQQDLDNILIYINKNAKQAIEENGSSTLYLAVGLLKWYDRKTPDQPRYAPVLLLPVEISRRSVNSKFILKSRGEEAMINITLVEFLRQEYKLNLSALEQLPHDEKGVDVAKVMGTLRRAIMQLKGWDVEEQLVLGNFSFSKLILWKDIVTHQEDLQKSNLVKSLIEGKLTFNDHDSLTDIDYESIQSESIILPIATDVSQKEAVLAAQKGQSFVLHGPPGTGKSQTITNIIADALYRGKRVLFVAAKKAALDVVHKRLEQIGLSPFSLELHSNKSKKSDVLEQLSKSLETGRVFQSADFTHESQRLDAVKKSLSDYVNVLHEKQPVGWSLYDSITALENYNHQNFDDNFIYDNTLGNLDTTLWQQWTDWLPQFQSIIRLIKHPEENPLAAFKLLQYSTSVSNDIEKQTQNLLQLLHELEQRSKAIASAVHFPFNFESEAEIENLIRVITELKKMPDTSLDLCIYLTDNNNYYTYEKWNNYFNQYQSLLKSILQNYNRRVLDIDLTSIELEWKHALQSWFLPKWFKVGKIKKQLTAFRNVPFTNDYKAEIEQLFILNNQLLEVQRILQQSDFIEFQKVLKGLFKDEHTELPEIDKKATMVKQLTTVMNFWGYNSFRIWIQLLLEKNVSYSDEIKLNPSASFDELLKVWETFDEQKKNYENLTGFSFHTNKIYLDENIESLQNIHNSLGGLKDWINYYRLYKEGEELHLQWLLNAYKMKLCNSENFTDFFYYTSHLSIAQHVIAKHECLNMFNVDLFQSKIEQYKKIAKDFQYITIRELQFKLAERLPNPTVEAMQSSEIGILQRAIKNKGRGISIRKLFDKIPTLLPRLAPCMLMSPISVAQYFTVDIKHFDLVIFDEASQLPTCEAVSALARAKQSIIVGDPKQMPPTSFFSTIKLDEENMDVEDLESILDDCLTLSMPSKYLLRHYRSKHESLIAFSNMNYYDNKLLTFPSADDLNRKVKYHHVEGFYDKGKTRTNKFEADAIIEYIRTHYSNEKNRKLSLGIVTFSQTQQNLIEDKLHSLFMINPQVEAYASESEEPLFIKNLENVQGDERDIILFSIGYANDEEGKISMNFGPLNRDGGWRRLNVAVTRARYEMHIFASLKSEQIDLSRTASQGVAGLKAFLHFAEKGNLALHPEDVKVKSERPHLSEYISKRLQEKGLKVKCNIGTSAFKMDIGVVHPDKPQQYILGIIIDGYYYYNARTTNDREMVMPSVLKALGWNIHRIWTLDWYENSNTIIDSIVERVEKISSLDETIEEADTDTEIISFPVFDPLKIVHESPDTTKVVSKQIPYVSHILTPVPGANSEIIYDFQHRNLLKQQIQNVIDVEAPISKNHLFKKVLHAWNTSRAGARLDKHLQNIIKETNLVKKQHHQTFYWKADNDTVMDYYRSNTTERRNIEDIAPEEIIAALQEVVSANLSIDEEELIRYMAKVFGFAKVGRQLDTQIRYAMDLAEKDGILMKDGGRVKISG